MSKTEIMDRIEELDFFLTMAERTGASQTQAYYEKAAEWNKLNKMLKGEV